ncbi:MAG TPA: signal peptidase I [Thermosulfidibacter takaii]|uniref:Signal peptidase I n=1 Tax=Thermosulfidibacter takaii TaxID=412593 RepID=A0A7C0Y7D1_9BACT|nr:signal peptidase I [Thermosulfidibacter takaii]
MEGKLLKETPTFWAKVWEYAKSILIALIIALLIRTFIVQAFRIPSGSMIPTLLVGDHILVNKLAYRFGEPHRLDVVVFKFPLDSNKDYIKRVIGLPGDRLKIVNKVVFINGKPLKEPYARHTDSRTIPRGIQPRDNYGPVVVPPGHYFVMGDNRDSSYDSRFWGFVSRKALIGKALIIYFSWDPHGANPLHWVRWRRIGRLIH